MCFESVRETIIDKGSSGSPLIGWIRNSNLYGIYGIHYGGEIFKHKEEYKQ